MNLPTIGAIRHTDGLPPGVTSHASGGRDLWSEALTFEPPDPAAAAWTCLREVLDPEIPISLVDLGLIYDLEITAGTAVVSLTYTATACPCMAFIREDLTDRLLMESWIDRVSIEEVWDPPWTTDLITPEGRAQLKKLGVGV